MSKFKREKNYKNLSTIGPGVAAVDVAWIRASLNFDMCNDFHALEMGNLVLHVHSH